MTPRSLLTFVAKHQPAFATLAVGGLGLLLLATDNSQVANSTVVVEQTPTAASTAQLFGQASEVTTARSSEATNPASVSSSSDSATASLAPKTPPVAAAATGQPATQSPTQATVEEPTLGTLSVSVTSSGEGENRAVVETETSASVNGKDVPVADNQDIRIDVRNEDTLNDSDNTVDVDIRREVTTEQDGSADHTDRVDHELSTGNNDVSNNENPVSVRNGSVKIDLKFSN